MDSSKRNIFPSDVKDKKSVDLTCVNEIPLDTKTELPEREIPKDQYVFYTEYITEKSIACFHFIKSLKLEVVMFVFMFAYVVKSVSSTTMLIEKTCRVHLDYPKNICDNIKSDPELKLIKEEVEKLANNYQVGHNLIQLVPSSVIACFVGPWSDVYGRKAPVIAALIGIILDSIGSTFCAYYIESRIEYFFIPAIFTGISGGYVASLTVIYSSASDLTTAANRTIKYTLLELSFGLGVPLGILLGGILFKYYGYVPVFAVSVTGNLFGLIWVVFVIEETRGIGNKDSWITKIRRLFSFDSLVESFRTTLKKRPHQGRKQIWLLILSASIIILASASTASIAYLYTYHRYGWDNTKYSFVSSIYNALTIFVLMISVPLLTKVLKLGDPALGILGTASHMAKSLVIGLASTQSVYYLANALGLLSGTANLPSRARISKIVSKNELGKVFAFLATAESMLPILSTAVFSQIFNASLSFEPGLAYFILTALLLISLAVYIWLACLPTVSYEEMLDENTDEETDEKPGEELQDKITVQCKE